MNSLLDAVSLVSGEEKSGSPAKKKGKKSKVEDIVWNDARSLALLSAILKHKAHKKTDTTLQLKMKAVVKDLKDHHLFYDYDRDCFDNQETFDVKWKRIRKTVTKKFALESEGANLSGLDDDSVSEVEKLCISMIEDDMKTKADAAAAKEATIKKNQSMLSFEGSILKKTVVANPKEANQLLIEVENDENDSPNISTTGMSSLSSNASMMSNDHILRIAQSEREIARKAKYDFEREKMELEKQKMAQESRRLNCMEQMLTMLVQDRLAKSSNDKE